MALLDPQVGLGGASGNHQGEWPVLARLMETQIWHLPASSVQGKAHQRNHSLCQHFCLGESCPFNSHPKPGNSVPPCMFLALYELLPQHWSSEGVRLSKSVCMPFKRHVWDPRNPPSHLVMGTSLPSTGTLGWGTWCGVGTLYSWG